MYTLGDHSHLRPAGFAAEAAGTTLKSSRPSGLKEFYVIFETSGRKQDWAAHTAGLGNFKNLMIHFRFFGSRLDSVLISIQRCA